MPSTKSSLVRVEDLLKKTLKSLNLGETFKVHPIWKNWQAIAGPAIASRSKPEYVAQETLYLQVANSVWANELEMQKKSLIKKINEQNYGFVLKDIRFTIKKD
jgi:predicted nucleic acid-binding Zn ribbon protein